MDKEQAYTSLQAYLEYCFSTITHVTPEMVAKAKVEYRKIYQSRYRKQYRERYIQVTFRIERKQYEQLKKIAQQQNIKTTSLIKQRVLEQQQPFDQSEAMKESFLNIMDFLEEAIHEDEPISLTELLQHITIIYNFLP